jgi:hypothetical protein
MGVTDWRQLQGWQAPRSYVYTSTYQNGFGSDVVKFDYRVTFTYGGNLEGKGAYLSQVTVLPAELDVAWGYTFNASAKVPNVVNMGTHDAPIGAAQIQVGWKVNTVFKTMETTKNYYATGAGTYSDIDGEPTHH